MNGCVWMGPIAYTGAHNDINISHTYLKKPCTQPQSTWQVGGPWQIFSGQRVVKNEQKSVRIEVGGVGVPLSIYHSAYQD